MTSRSSSSGGTSEGRVLLCSGVRTTAFFFGWLLRGRAGSSSPQVLVLAARCWFGEEEVNSISFFGLDSVILRRNSCLLAGADRSAGLLPCPVVAAMFLVSIGWLVVQASREEVSFILSLGSITCLKFLEGAISAGVVAAAGAASNISYGTGTSPLIIVLTMSSGTLLVGSARYLLSSTLLGGFFGGFFGGCTPTHARTN